mmetsp:Transcript_7891/g.15292  ORF Transcript_7891/g.15292 Transcript_7891/m.15292 type:complete len:459 (-) Transcript_7891:12331-13707(-)
MDASVHVTESQHELSLSDASNLSTDGIFQLTAAQARKAEIVLRLLGYMPTRHSRIVIPPIRKLKPLERINSASTITEPKRAKLIHNPSNKIEQARLSQKLTFEPSYHGMEGVRCYDMVYSILQKDPSLNIRVPLTLIMNCGNPSPRMLYFSKGKLKSSELNLSMRQIKHIFATELSALRQEGDDLPVAVARYANKFTKFYMGSFELERYWPDIYNDSIVQAFILPKGLVVSKTRVVLRPDTTRVFVVSNKSRVDGIEENVLMKHREDYKAVKIKKIQEASLYKEIESTLMNRSQILRKLKASDAMDTITINKPAQGLAKVYSLFKNDFSTNDMKLSEPKRKPMVERFSAHCNSAASNIYEVPSCKYEKLIQITEKLKASITEHHLLNERVESIVADFIQGGDGEWYFINLKHLGLLRSKRSRLNLSIDKLIPKNSSRKALKPNLSTDDGELMSMLSKM